jgi:hypothetical protein
MKKSTYPISSLVKLHTNLFEDPQNDKKKIQNFENSKYENKKLSKFTKRKENTPFSPFVKPHTNFFEDPQNDKKKN